MICLGLAGCASQKPMSSTTQNSRYSEDLSVWRPKAALTDSSHNNTNAEPVKKEFVTARHTVNQPLDNVLDSINSFNLNRKFVDGYTIQIFTGDKEGALDAKRRLTLVLPDIESEIKFDPPTFRVKVGRYYRPLDAQKDFVAIKKHFSSAILIPDKIAIN